MIKKPTQTEFFKEDIPYDIYSREVVQSIRDPVALGMYCYLMSKPANWVPCRAHLMEHFDIGRDRYQKAMNDLKQMGLVYALTIRNGQGQVLGTRLCVEARGRTEGRVSHSSVKPAAGSADGRLTRPIIDKEIIKDTESNKDKESKRPPKKKFVPPTLEDCIAYATERNATAYAKDFFDYYSVGEWHDMYGNKIQNWKQKFLNYVKREKKFSGNGSSTKPTYVQPTRDF